LDVSAENLDVTRKLNPTLGLCNLMQENKPCTTNDLRMKGGKQCA